MEQFLVESSAAKQALRVLRSKYQLIPYTLIRFVSSTKFLWWYCAVQWLLNHLVRHYELRMHQNKTRLLYIFISHAVVQMHMRVVFVKLVFHYTYVVVIRYNIYLQLFYIQYTTHDKNKGRKQKIRKECKENKQNKRLGALYMDKGENEP